MLPDGAAIHLHILATSREGLGIAGEQVYGVSPLSTPDPAYPPTLRAALTYEAVALLVDRAQSVQPRFELSQANLKDVVETRQVGRDHRLIITVCHMPPGTSK